MNRRRRKSIGRAIAALAVTAVVVLAVCLRPLIEEQWHIWQLDSREPSVREAAAEHLGEKRSVRAIPRLVELLEESATTWKTWPERPFSAAADDRTRMPAEDPFAAGDALERIGTPAIPALLRVLRSADATTDAKEYAAQTLIAIRPPDVTALLEAAAHTNPGVRAIAVRGLGWLGPDGGSEARASILRALRDGNDNVRLAAASAFSLERWVTRTARRYHETLERASTGESPEARREAGRELAAVYYPWARPALPALLNARRDTDAVVSSNAHMSLGSILGFWARDAVPILIAALDDPSPDVRSSAAWYLAACASAPDARREREGAVEALTRAQADEHPAVSHCAMASLEVLRGSSPDRP